MKLTLFTVEEANQVLGTIRPLLERLVAGKREMESLDRRIEALTLALSGASSDNPDAKQLREVIARRTRIATRLRDGVHSIHARGAVVKDLDRGLIDFYSVVGDRLIFLCWKLGEDEIGHWHSLEAGFGGRQPLSSAGQE